jgi:prepilin signal peptidase PulO-like enzyme (type II secretory pathway)
MGGRLLVRAAIILCYYIMGAYATTDILRLLKGASLPVWGKDCYCPICGNRIRLADQIPIISYVIGGGRCRSCGSKIPFSDLWLELSVLLYMSLVTLLFGFSYISLGVNIVSYELLKIVCCIVYGIREKNFVINYIYSLAANAFIFIIMAFFFLIEHLV